MIGHAMLLGLLVVGAQGPRGAAPAAAADRITLRDGSVVVGLVTSATTGPRASVDFLVRRAWAEKSVKHLVTRWDRATAATSQRALAERRQRLEAWRRERAASVAQDDRIIQWIDHELARSPAKGGPQPSILVLVHLPRSEVRTMERQPALAERLLRLAWLCNLPEPETMTLDRLKNALEDRGYAVDAIGKTPPAALDRLLPPAPEPESAWLARRAATELSVDPDLRFIRFQDTVLPEPAPGQPLGAMGLSTALSELKRLLDPDQGPQADPLAEKLKGVGARGRTGAIVTRLEISPDLSGVTVESTLWVRSGERWLPYGSRNAMVRPEDVGGEAGKNLAADPQVQGAFKLVEGLGLGEISADLKDRSLKIGAATEKALGMARSAFNQDLDALALPVLEPARDNPVQAPNDDQRAPR
jgi:hypothetical protein